MATLNRGAAEAGARAGVRAGTDVTGFGLLGHLRNLALASGLRAEIRARDVPLLPGATDLAAAGHVPGGSHRNLADLMEDVAWEWDVPEPLRIALADAQTSGGLLLCVPPDRVEDLLADLEEEAPATALVGELVEGRPGAITVL
jgi:selenide,water dikinase